MCALSNTTRVRAAGTLTNVKKNNDSYAGLERIKQLEAQLARAPVNSDRHRQTARAIRIEADLYRKSLDSEQARRHTGSGSIN